MGIASFFLAIPGHGFDYEDLASLIKSKRLASIEEVLAQLPKAYLQNFTLAYDSKSLHGSSYDFPRAVLFGTDAKLILAFNGDPTHSGYLHLEVMQFRDQTSEFEMRSITFENGVRFSTKNPPLCLTCHGHNPRPIWSSYEYTDIEQLQHWPGFYGSTHDAPDLDSVEEDAYTRFRKLAKKHPRYRFLQLSHTESEWYPFGSGPHQHRFRPNNRLGNLLARLNARRLAVDLMTGDFFRKYPNISLQWLLQCDQAEESHYLNFAKALYEDNFGNLAHLDLDRYQSKSVEQVAFVFEKLLSGGDVYTWNMSLAPTPADGRFSTGIVSIDELVAAVVLARLPDTHWVGRYYRPWMSEQLYETFDKNYYVANVAPGGVGQVYDSMGPFFDRDHAKQACPQLDVYSRQEVGMDGIGSQ